MGAWGTGPFENDEASEWADDLEDATDATPLYDALELAAETPDGGYLGADAGEQAVAAAVLVAVARGALADDGLPGPALAWLAAHGDDGADDDLALLASRALERVLANRSEIRELWAGSDEPAAWHADVERLREAIARS